MKGETHETISRAGPVPAAGGGAGPDRVRRPPGEEDTGKLQVVCTLFPYYDFVRAIGGDRVEPYLLVTAGREAHSFEPTPLDVIRISQADVFICNGGESETWVDDILDAAGESIGSVVHMMDHAHVLGEEFSEGMQGGHDHDEHAHDEHDGHDHDGHEEEIEYDEHIWTSPRIAMGPVPGHRRHPGPGGPRPRPGVSGPARGLSPGTDGPGPGLPGHSGGRAAASAGVRRPGSRCCISAGSTAWTTGRPSTAAPATPSRPWLR